jgi:hypothetical protein
MDLKQIINLHLDGNSNREISRTLSPVVLSLASADLKLANEK